MLPRMGLTCIYAGPKVCIYARSTKEDDPMSTDTIYKATCIACGYSTTNPKMLRILLEVDSTCPVCEDGGIYFSDTEG